MLDIKHTHRIASPQGAHPSLLSLRMALTIAEREAPARPVIQITADEKCAMILIEKMKTEYDKRLSFSRFIRRSAKSPDVASKVGDFALHIWEVVEANA